MTSFKITSLRALSPNILRTLAVRPSSDKLVGTKFSPQQCHRSHTMRPVAILHRRELKKISGIYSDLRVSHLTRYTTSLCETITACFSSYSTKRIIKSKFCLFLKEQWLLLVSILLFMLAYYCVAIRPQVFILIQALHFTTFLNFGKLFNFSESYFSHM